MALPGRADSLRVLACIGRALAAGRARAPGCGAVATSSGRAGALRVLACIGRALAAGRARAQGCGAVATSSGRAAALRVLVEAPETDAVLLRRAAAWRRSGDSRWTAARATLRERAAELTRRGEDPALHGRELALAALWLDDDAAAALVHARANLLLQREPVDWWVAMASARKANDPAALAQIGAAIRTAGLHDVRLAPGAAAVAPARRRLTP